jgi:hypothetical protein
VIAVLSAVAVQIGCGGSPAAPGAPTSTACTVAVNLSGDPHVSAPARCVRFAGYDWIVKSAVRFNPGPNAWSDSTANVFVDAAGLHLRITQDAGRWLASEVILNQMGLGYGTYTFRTATSLAGLDSQAVLGLFTYDYPSPPREIDIEFGAQLGFTPGATAHFTIQPYRASGHTHDFHTPSGVSAGIHSFEWRPGRVVFRSGAEEWTYVGSDVPVPGPNTSPRINLWLFDGQPARGQEIEVVVTSFEFRP